MITRGPVDATTAGNDAHVDTRIATLLSCPCYKPHMTDLSEMAERWKAVVLARTRNSKLDIPPELRSLSAALKTKQDRMNAGVMDDDVLFIEYHYNEDDCTIESKVVLKSLKLISPIIAPPSYSHPVSETLPVVQTAKSPEASASALKPLEIFGSPNTRQRKQNRWMPAGAMGGVEAGHWAYNLEPPAEKQKRKVGPKVKATAPRKRAKKAINTPEQGDNPEEKGQKAKGKSAASSRKKSTKISQTGAPTAGAPAQVNAPPATTGATSSLDVTRTSTAQSSTAANSRRSTKAARTKDNVKKDVAHSKASATTPAPVAPATDRQLKATKNDPPASQKASRHPTQLTLPPPTPRTPARLAREPAVTLNVTPTRRIVPLTRTPPSLLIRAHTPGIPTGLCYPMPIIAASPGIFSPIRGLSRASPLVQKLHEKSKGPDHVVIRGSPSSRLVLPVTPTFVRGTISRGKSSPSITPGSKAKSSILTTENVNLIVFYTPSKRGISQEKGDAADVAYKLSSPGLELNETNSSPLRGLFSDSDDQEEEASLPKPTALLPVEAEESVMPVLPCTQNDKQDAKAVAGPDEESEDDGGLGKELEFGLEELRSTQAAIAADDSDDDSEEEDMVEITLMQEPAAPSNAPVASAVTYYYGSDSDTDTDSDEEY